MQRILLNKGRKNFLKRNFFLLGTMLLFILLLFLSSCNQKLNEYYNCKWISDDPVIEFVVPTKEEIKEDNKYITGYVINEEETIEIICFWKRNNGIEIYFKDKFDETQEGILFDEWIAIAANPEEYNGNSVKFKVYRDNIFDNKYKNITLKRHDL